MKALSSILYLLSSVSLLAEPQEAWVARYNGGFTTNNHTPLAVKLDASGNIYVGGSLQNATNAYEYVVLKYAPNGTQLYAARYCPTNGGTYPANGFALDGAGNTYVTGGIIGNYAQYLLGNGATVKFDAQGQVAWVSPCRGHDMAVDTNGNVYVTGFSAVDFATVKLSPGGSNVWERYYDSGPGFVNVAQKVAVDEWDRVYVAGWEQFMIYQCYPGYPDLCYYNRPMAVCYDSAGSTLWLNPYTTYGQAWGETVAVLPDKQGNLYVTGNGGDSTFQTAKVDASGQTVWQYVNGSPPGVADMETDMEGGVYLAGGITSSDYTFRKGYGTFRLDSAGKLFWRTNYFGTPPTFTGNRATGMALGNGNNVYVTGVSTNAANRNDFATIQYDGGGHQLWVIRYNGPANGNDGATGIAVAPDGSIYVTGYSANESGGSDIVLIKYVMSATIQKTTDGNMLLQGYGLPSSNYTFQAGTNLLNWDPIGSSLADTNGLFQFTDTNAPLYPFRFYRWTLP